ncbi:hypothetical protein Hte_002581 [Hypoxylon texense]
MCTSNVWEYKRCKLASTTNCHQKSIPKYCLRQRAGLYANTYHPVRIINAIPTKSGVYVFRTVDETCPTCFLEEALAEQERRKQEEEKQAAEDKQRVDEATPDLSECLDPFSHLLS